MSGVIVTDWSVGHESDRITDEYRIKDQSDTVRVISWYSFDNIFCGNDMKRTFDTQHVDYNGRYRRDDTFPSRRICTGVIMDRMNLWSYEASDSAWVNLLSNN